jgi:tetratricopeptide (TPR) repeat protein
LFYLALAVDDLLSDGKLAEARPLAVRLAEGVQDVRVLGAAARLHTLANEPEVVLTLVDRYVRASDAGTTDGLVRQREAANLLDQLTRVAAARRLSAAGPLLAAAGERYRASLRAFPDAVAPMAALLAFAGQPDSALDLLERYKSRLSPPVLATAGLGVLRAGQATPRQFQTVHAWIDTAIGSSPNSTPLKLALGELLALRPDFPAADGVFRGVLQSDPNNVFALNNLAWILASRPETAEEAIRFIDRAIALAGVSPEMLDTRARILIAAGRYDRALADLADAGGSPLRYFHLALAYSKMGKSDDAAKAFRDGRARGLTERMVHPDDLPVFVALSSQVR